MGIGWKPGERTRKFLREVGSVVLGVLIALGLGAVASEIGWRMDVAQARQAISREIAESIGQANIRVRLSPCIERRLDALSDIVTKAEATGRLPPVGAISNPAWYTWPSGVWASVMSAQTATHFDRDALSGITNAYEFVRMLNEANRRELDVWTRVQALVGPGRKFAVSEAVTLRAAIADARLLNRFIGLDSVRLAQVVDAFGVPYDPAIARPSQAHDIAQAVICKPLGAPAGETYGQSPLRDAIGLALAAPITRDDPR